MRYGRLIILAILAALAFTGCSSVFSAYISGSVYDADEYAQAGDDGALDGAHIYLYSTEDARDSDYTAWFAGGEEDGPLPEERSTPSYFMIEYTDTDGTYTFSGFTWKSFNPDFGKTADREEVFFLIYHEGYGLQKNTDPDHIYVLSDTDNTVPDILVERRTNSTRVMGTVYDDTAAPLANVNAAVYVAEDWEYSGGSIDESTVTWPEDPTGRVVTGDDGEYDLTVTYPQKPSHAQNEGTTLARIVYTHSRYVAEHHADSDIIDSGWDADGDGEDDPYCQVELTDGVPFSVNDIVMAQEQNETVVTVSLSDLSTNSGVVDADVRVYLAEEWSYTAGGAIDAASVVWPTGVSYSGRTDADGEYSVGISFDRRPSVSDNKGTAPIRIVIEKDNMLLEEAYDAADAAWEPVPYGDDAESFYGKTITDDVDVTFEFTGRKTRFDDQQFTGYLFSDSYPSSSPVDNDLLDRTDTYDEGYNGVAAGLYLTDVQPAADSIDDAYMFDTTRPGTEGDGYFAFTGISWTDETYTGRRSALSVYLMIDSDRDDLWDQAVPMVLYADIDGGNYAEIEIL